MNTPQEWWKDFFHGVALDLWRAVTTEEQTRNEADFIEKSLRLPPQAKILDAPCGGGRLSLELASRGYQLAGVDIAPEFVCEAQEKAAERQLTITFGQGDMRDLPWQAAFDGAFCFGNSFGYFDDAGNEAYLRSVAGALKSGARLVMDTTAAEAILPVYQDRSWIRAGDILFLEENRYDTIQSRLDTEYTFVRDGKTEARNGSQRIYTYSELCRLLKEAGFINAQGYGSLDQEPFKLRSQRLYLVATKSA